MWLNKESENERYLGSVFSGVPVVAGDTFTRPSTGGGGFGDPLERDPESVLEDVVDDYVSVARAEIDYGVVVIERDAEIDDYEIDRDATEKARQRIRSERRGWLEEDPRAVAERYAAGEINAMDAVRRYGVILDWGTGELFPDTTAQYRSLMQRRSASGWTEQ